MGGEEVVLRFVLFSDLHPYHILNQTLKEKYGCSIGEKKPKATNMRKATTPIRQRAAIITSRSAALNLLTSLASCSTIIFNS